MCFQIVFECESLIANSTHILLGTGVTGEVIIVVHTMGVALPTRFTLVCGALLMYVPHVYLQPTFANKRTLAQVAHKASAQMLSLNVVA